MSGLTLDAGALIAFERANRQVVSTILVAVSKGTTIAIPAGVLAQAWRNGARQARLAQLLGWKPVEIEVLDEGRARHAGQLCGRSGTKDVIDASVVLCAKRRGHTIMTSDPGDLRRLDPNIKLDIV